MKIKVWTGRGTNLPTVYIHSVAGNGENVWKRCFVSGNVPEFNLVSIYDFNFEGEMTPWPAPGVRKGLPMFEGNAESHLKDLIEHIIPEAEEILPSPSRYNVIAGYSLAGLFAFWAAWNTRIFRRIACGSASFWYPGFIDYMKEYKMLASPDVVYISLGDNEANTKHPVMSRVGDCTDEVLKYLEAQAIPYFFEINHGNHFSDPDGRLAKAIIKTLKYDEQITLSDSWRNMP